MLPAPANRLRGCSFPYSWVELARWVLILTSCTPLLLPANVVGQDADESIDRHELYYGAHLPRNRAVSRALDLAEDLIAQRRYSEAAPLLLETLALPEDSLDPREETRRDAQGDASPGGAGVSLKARARALLADLPPAGRRAYRLEVETPSERELSEAIAAGDLQAVLVVSRRYPETLAAATADWILANAAIERGEFQLALAATTRLRESSAGVEFEPQRSLLEATAAFGLGESEKGQRLIESVSQTYGPALELAPGAPLTGAGDFGAQLARIVSGADVGDWLVPGGGAQRNPVRAGEPPHPWARWTALAVVDPREDDRLSQYAYHLQTRRRPTAPACQPVAAGDLVFMRTAENLVAIDYQTGRRVWETRSERGGEDRQGLRRERRRTNDDGEAALLTQETLQTWFDKVHGGVATDAERVYIVEPIRQSASRDERWSPFQLQRGPFDSMLGVALNRLAAYDIATEGKLVWSLGANEAALGRNKQPKLAGAFFLGPGLPIGENLAALVEIDQTISLVEIDASTGKLLWRQALVSIERGVDQNTMRRLVGASVAQSGSTLYCSTGAGVVVAVDIARRSLLWVDRFPVEEDRPTNTPLPWRRRSRDPWPENVEEGWLDNRVIVAGDRVVIASPESPLVHCLDRHTGQAHWRAERKEGVSLLAVVGESVLVSEAQSIRALDLATGGEDWRSTWDDSSSGSETLTAAHEGSALMTSTPLASAVISGQGVVIGDALLVPLSDGSLLQVDPRSGDIRRRQASWSGSGAGNLIVHRGSLLSQTYNALDRYDQSGPLLLAAERMLEQDSTDIVAQCLLGEALLSAGEVDGAIGRFTAAYKADPDSPLARDRLRRGLALRLRAGGPNSADLAILERLVDAPGQRLSLKVQGIELATQESRGGFESAIDLAIEFAAESASESTGEAEGLMVVDQGHFVAPTARVAALVGAAWDRADPTSERSARESIIAAAVRVTSTSQLDRLTRVFSETPAAAALEAQLLARLEAEGYMLPLAFRRAAMALDADDASAGGGELETSLDTRWAVHVAVARTAPREAADPERTFAGRADSTPGWRAVKILGGADTAVDHALVVPIAQMALDTDSGLLVGADGSGAPVFRSQLRGVAAGFIQQALSEEAPSVWRLGPCLYLTGEGQVAALETLPGGAGEDRRLWTTDGLSQSIARATRLASAQTLGPASERIELDPAQPVAILAVSPRGVIVRSGEVVAALHPLTGVPLWIRSDPKYLGGVRSENVFATGAELYAVTHVLHSHAGRSEHESRGRRWSLIDGSDATSTAKSQRGDWDPPPGEWIAKGRDTLVTLDETAHENSSGKRLFVTRVTTSERLLSRDYHSRVLVAETEGGAIATLEPTGRLELIEPDAGRLIVSVVLPLRTAPLSFTPVVRHGRLLVMVTPRATASGRADRLTPLDAGATVVSEGLAEVHAVDLATGHLAWPRPALVYRRGWLERQPRDSPLLVFGARVETRERNRRTIRTRLLVLDAYSGRTLYRDDDIEDNAAGKYQIRYQGRAAQGGITPGSSSPELQIDLPQQRITIALTGAPAPPTLPASDLAETDERSGPTGGLMQQFQQMFGGSIQIKPANRADE